MQIALWIALGLIFVISVSGLIWLGRRDEIDDSSAANSHRRVTRLARVDRPRRTGGSHRL